MIGAPNPHLSFFALIIPFSNVNNLVSSSQNELGTSEYTYNSDGFPISSVTKENNHTLYTAEYEYVVK